MINKLGLPKRSSLLYILTLVIIPIAFLAIVEYANASDTQEYREALITPGSSAYCDHWFNALWFEQVPPLIQAQCSRRFGSNVASIRRSFIRNSHHHDY